jgi:hypothetical protein
MRTGDCTPRLPAVRFQVKKKGRNNGKWFYICQKPKGKQCGFFVWEDAAQMREKDALFNGGEAEGSDIRIYIRPAGAPEPPLPPFMRSSRVAEQKVYVTSATVPSSDRALRRVPMATRIGEQDGFSLPSISTGDELDFMSCADEESQKRSSEKQQSGSRHVMPEATPSKKRDYGLFVDDSDDDDFSGAELNSEEERELVSLAESASQSQVSQAQRREGQQRQQQTGQFTTPSAQRTHDVINGLPTPNTSRTVGRNTLLIATEQRDQEGKRRRIDPPVTPSGVRTGSSSARQRSEPSQSWAGADDYPITEEVMALLGGVPMLDDDVRNSVRRTLNTYALRMKGVENGRDVSRSVVQAKDARIAELQARVAQLENEKSVNRQRMEDFLKNGLRNMA